MEIPALCWAISRAGPSCVLTTLFTADQPIGQFLSEETRTMITEMRTAPPENLRGMLLERLSKLEEDE